MKNKRHLNPADIDSALTGSAVAPGFESLSTWAAEIRGQSATEIPRDVAAAQIAMMAETAAGANPGGAGYAALKPSRIERIRRRLVFGSLLSGIGAKVFAASVALATATGGVTATGSLPDAVQDPVASIYNSIGFDFPTSHDDDCATDDGCEKGNDTDGEEAPTTTSGNNSDDVKSKNDSDDSDDDENDDSDDDDDTDGDNGDSDGDDDADADADDSDDDDDSADDSDDNDSDDKPDNDNKGKGNNNKGGGGNDGNPGDGDGDDDQGDDDQGDDDQGDQGGGDEG